MVHRQAVVLVCLVIIAVSVRSVAADCPPIPATANYTSTCNSTTTAPSGTCYLECQPGACQAAMLTCLTSTWDAAPSSLCTVPPTCAFYSKETLAEENAVSNCSNAAPIPFGTTCPITCNETLYHGTPVVHNCTCSGGFSDVPYCTRKCLWSRPINGSDTSNCTVGTLYNTGDKCSVCGQPNAAAECNNGYWNYNLDQVSCSLLHCTIEDKESDCPAGQYNIGDVCHFCSAQTPVRTTCEIQPEYQSIASDWSKNYTATCYPQQCPPIVLNTALFYGDCVMDASATADARFNFNYQCTVYCAGNGGNEVAFCTPQLQHPDFYNYLGAFIFNNVPNVTEKCGVGACSRPGAPAGVERDDGHCPAGGNYLDICILQCQSGKVPDGSAMVTPIQWTCQPRNSSGWGYHGPDLSCSSPNGFDNGAVILVAAIILFVGGVIGGCCCLRRRAKRREREAAVKLRGVSMDATGDSTVRLGDGAMSDRITKLLSAPGTQLVGSGGTADVYLAVMGGNEVAIKRLKATQKGHSDEFSREATILGLLVGLSHPNVVAMLQYVDNPPTIIMEYAGGGSLRTALPSLTATQQKSYMVQVASGVAFIHAHNVVHLDLKPENILLSSTGVAKLTDFGTSRQPADTTGPNNGPPDGLALVGAFVGTVQYAAPERFRTGARIDLRKADVFSLGMTMWCIASKQAPFAGDTLETVVDFAVAGSYESKLSMASCPPEIAPHIVACINRDPLLRPTSAQMQASLEGKSLSSVGDETVRFESNPTFSSNVTGSN